MENSFNSAEKVIKDKRFTKLKRDLKEPLLEYFENEDNQKILIDIFTQEEINDFLNSKKIPPEKINKLKEVSEYYSKYYPSSKNKEINEINEIIKNEKGNIEKYLKDYDEAKKTKIREPLINIIHEKKENTEENIKKSKETWNKYEDMINRKVLVKIPKGIKKELFKYFKDEENKNRLTQIFNEDIYDFLIKQSENILKKEILSEEIIEKLKIVLNYYKNYFPETKKEDIDLLEKAIEKKEEFDYKKYLDNNLDEMKNKNNRFKIIEFLLEKNNKK